MGTHHLTFGILVWPILATAAGATSPREKIDFRGDVVPILEARCFSCHRGADASASYRLDLRAELLGETTGRPLVKIGKSADSRLIHVLTSKKMPRKGKPLSAGEVDVFRKWIDQGLPWDDELFPASTKSAHWAFQPIKAPVIPKVKDQAWVQTPIDAFIAAKHAEQGLTPAASADARILLRRLSLDLTGLPPAAEELDAFALAASARPQAAIRGAVERLLASPHYGERWGRHWLDVARWAESEGYESNHLRPFAWRYRDWVVSAFQRDLPFADFVRQQLAGDELSPYADEHLIATGFLAAARLSSNEEDRLRQRNDYLVDIVNTAASAFLGLTMQCAQCHKHKFDPITARDYYRFLGYFVKGQPGNLALRDSKLWADYAAKKPKNYDATARIRDELYETARKRKTHEVFETFSSEQRRALQLPREERTPAEDKLAREADLLLQFSSGQIERALTADEKKRYDEAKRSAAELEKGMLEMPQTWGYYSPVTSPHKVDVLPMKGFYPLSFEPKELARAKSFLFEAGGVHRPAFAVDPGLPAILLAGHASHEPPNPSLARPANRLDLADAIAKSPLAARVHVNRIWQHHFGRGLAATPNDFGIKGARPTHPELLDYLASELLRTGSTKHIHRLIVLSNTYQQASSGNAANTKRDPDNHFLWRWSPRRLESEAIRDSWLAASGELDKRVGGPSGEVKSLRRSLYLLQKREAPPAMQALLDGPIAMTESCGRRNVTTVPLQPLYLLNSDFSVARSKALARRVEKLAGTDRAKQIAMTYRLVLAREPDAKERQLGERFLDRGSLEHYCQAILNLNEFLYLE